jgi:Na+-driven multidrug efflux pump
MFELLLSIFCSYRNAQLARRKGQNTVIWVIITMVAFFLGYFIGSVAMVSIFYRGDLTPQAMMAFLVDRPLIVVTIMFFALGGYLLVRYILERMPDVKSNE